MFLKIDVRHVGWTRPSCDGAQKPSDSRWSGAVGLPQEEARQQGSVRCSEFINYLDVL